MGHFFHDSRMLATAAGALGLVIPGVDPNAHQGGEQVVPIATPRVPILCGTATNLPRVSSCHNSIAMDLDVFFLFRTIDTYRCSNKSSSNITTINN